jgi:hypothetical protein
VCVRGLSALRLAAPVQRSRHSAIPDRRDAFRKFDIETVERKRDHAVEAHQCDQFDYRRPTEHIGELIYQIRARAASFDQFFGGGMNEPLQIVFVGNFSSRLQRVDDGVGQTFRTCASGVGPDSNSAFQCAPVVRIANSRSLPGSTERKRNRSPISAATLPNDGICIHGLNGPGRDLRGSRKLAPRGPVTMYSQKAFCSASRSLGPTSGSRDI